MARRRPQSAAPTAGSTAARPVSAAAGAVVGHGDAAAGLGDGGGRRPHSAAAGARKARPTSAAAGRKRGSAGSSSPSVARALRKASSGTFGSASAARGTLQTAEEFASRRNADADVLGVDKQDVQDVAVQNARARKAARLAMRATNRVRSAGPRRPPNRRKLKPDEPRTGRRRRGSSMSQASSVVSGGSMRRPTSAMPVMTRVVEGRELRERPSAAWSSGSSTEEDDVRPVRGSRPASALSPTSHGSYADDVDELDEAALTAMEARLDSQLRSAIAFADVDETIEEDYGWVEAENGGSGRDDWDDDVIERQAAAAHGEPPGAASAALRRRDASAPAGRGAWDAAKLIIQKEEVARGRSSAVPGIRQDASSLAEVALRLRALPANKSNAASDLRAQFGVGADLTGSRAEVSPSASRVRRPQSAMAGAPTRARRRPDGSKVPLKLDPVEDAAAGRLKSLALPAQREKVAPSRRARSAAVAVGAAARAMRSLSAGAARPSAAVTPMADGDDAPFDPLAEESEDDEIDETKEPPKPTIMSQKDKRALAAERKALKEEEQIRRRELLVQRKKERKAAEAPADWIDVLKLDVSASEQVDIFADFRRYDTYYLEGMKGYWKKKYIVAHAHKTVVELDALSQAVAEGFMMSKKMLKAVRRRFLEWVFDQKGCANLTKAQIRTFTSYPHRCMGSVPYWVCFHHLGEPRSPFLYLLIDQMLAPTLVTPPVVASATKHMRTKYDKPKIQVDRDMLSMIRQATKVPNGLLSWDEFFQTMMLLATYTRREMLRTIFDLFDTDGSGDIDAREFKTLTMAINQSGVSFPGNFSLALSHYDIDGDGVMSFEEMVKMDDRYPSVLYPAFRLQRRIRDALMPIGMWDQIAYNREFMTKYMAAHHGQAPPEALRKRGAPTPSVMRKLLIKMGLAKELYEVKMKTRTIGRVGDVDYAKWGQVLTETASGTPVVNYRVKGEEESGIEKPDIGNRQWRRQRRDMQRAEALRKQKLAEQRAKLKGTAVEEELAAAEKAAKRQGDDQEAHDDGRILNLGGAAGRGYGPGAGAAAGPGAGVGYSPRVADPIAAEVLGHNANQRGLDGERLPGPAALGHIGAEHVAASVGFDRTSKSREDKERGTAYPVGHIGAQRRPKSASQVRQEKLQVAVRTVFGKSDSTASNASSSSTDAADERAAAAGTGAMRRPFPAARPKSAAPRTAVVRPSSAISTDGRETIKRPMSATQRRPPGGGTKGRPVVKSVVRSSSERLSMRRRSGRAPIGALTQLRAINKRAVEAKEETAAKRDAASAYRQRILRSMAKAGVAT